MQDIQTTTIVRLEDGSIDYPYHARQGMMARSREVRDFAQWAREASRTKLRQSPTLFSVLLLVLVF